jgi:putative SOS response-associated peptidase YedK
MSSSLHRPSIPASSDFGSRRAGNVVSRGRRSLPWSRETEATPEEFKALLKPCPLDMEAVPISSTVISVKNEGAELVECAG